MSQTTDDHLTTMIHSSAAALGLPIEPEWLPSIRANLDVSLRLGRSVEEFSLADEHEPASVFKA